MAAFLEISDVGVRFKPTAPRVLRDVRLQIARGEYVAIIGHSGCGKSTLLNVIAGLLAASEGGVLLEGREVDEPGPDRAVVFQNHSLLPWLTCRENVRIAVDQVFGRRKSRAERAAWVDENLALVHMRPAADKRPGEISGGMKQRIGIARALAMQPELLVADEPVSALDVSVQAQVLELFAQVREQFQLAMVFITHDLRVAGQMCDHIAVMQRGEVVEYGETHKVLSDPQHAYTRKLIEAVPRLAAPPSHLTMAVA